jgi:hypothetical protein
MHFIPSNDVFRNFSHRANAGYCNEPGVLPGRGSPLRLRLVAKINV